ncbi:MAG: hypothetical protein RDU59_10015 [Thermodesulfobacteriota bacterium]|nr:hypothetical protein [Thermodesulfobacteriota bacterium]
MSQAIINLIKNALYDGAFLDIKKASSGNSKIGAFILASCFIDYMAGFVCGRETKPKDYKDFVSHYLPSIYNPSKLYKDLRCRLVHNYSEGGSYWFKDNKPELHGKTMNGRTIINLENFIDDLGKAFNKLLEEIKSDPSRKQKAVDRYNSIGLLCVGGLAPRKM